MLRQKDPTRPLKELIQNPLMMMWAMVNCKQSFFFFLNEINIESKTNKQTNKKVVNCNTLFVAL